MSTLLVLLDAAAKSAVLIVFAMVCMVPLRRASAAVRHLVWCLTLGGVLLLPVMSLVLPRWNVALLPRQATPSVIRTDFSQAMYSVAPDFAGTATGSSAPHAAGAASLNARVTDVSVRGPLVLRAAPQPQAARPVWRAPSAKQTARALIALWALGCVLLLARLGLGRLGVARLMRSAQRVDDPEWVQLVGRLGRAVGVHRSVLLLRSDCECVPMTWGVARPVIMVPASSVHWRAERRSVVLLHELAHVSRGDAATQLLGQLAQAIQWFNPFVWIAARKLREEREHACDDRVIAIGTRPVEYADHLLHLVATFGMYEGPVAALAMARRSQFEGRVIAILDPRARRGTVGRVGAAAAIAIALCSVPALAALRATRATDGAPDADKVTTTRHAVNQRATQQTVVPQQPVIVVGETVREQPTVLTARPARVVAEQQRDTVRGLLEQLVRVTGSDGDRARLIVEAAKIYAATPVKLMEVVNATALISSSGDRRSTLSTLMATAPLLPGQRAQMLRLSSTIASSGDKAQFLIEYLARFPLDATSRDAFFSTAATVASSGDLQRVLATAITRAPADEPTTSAILQTARRIAASGDKSSVLQQLGAHGNIKSDRLRREYIEVATTIGSSSDRENALSVLLGPESARTVSAAVRAAQLAQSPSDVPAGASRSTTTRTTDTSDHSSEAGTTTEVAVSYTNRGDLNSTVSIQARNYFKTPDGRGIARIVRGGSIVIQEIVPGEHRMLTIGGTGDQLTYTYRVNGIERAFDQTARDWLAMIVTQYM